MRKFNYCADYIFFRNNRTYEFGIQNGADADMSINIKLGLDACARLIPIAEECLGNYIPQLFPIVFLDETVNVRCTYAYALPVLAPPLDTYTSHCCPLLVITPLLTQPCPGCPFCPRRPSIINTTPNLKSTSGTMNARCCYGASPGPPPLPPWCCCFLFCNHSVVLRTSDVGRFDSISNASKAGQVCGHGTDPSDENVCTTKANTCTNAPCKCPGLQRKVVHTYGTPVNTCWSCEASATGDNYDDDDDDNGNGDTRRVASIMNRDKDKGDDKVAGDQHAGDGQEAASGRDVVATILAALPRASWAPGKLYLDMHAFNAPNSSSGVLVDSLKAAVAAATGSTATTMVEVAVDEAFVPWGVLKHAGWNEPVNHLRSSTEFYRRLFQTIPGAPHDMPTLLQYHKHHSSSSS